MILNNKPIICDTVISEITFQSKSTFRLFARCQKLFTRLKFSLSKYW